MRARRVRRVGGLTLIEMLLAVVVLGLVAASIAAAFIAASDLVEKGRGSTELVQAGRAAMNRLLAELRTVVAIEERSDNYLRVFCSGTTDSGSFSRRVEFWAEDGTLWRRVEGEDKQALAEHVQGFWTGGLTLWSKLSSSADVLYPQVGPAGTFLGTPQWRQVHFGPGFWSTSSSSRAVSFPTSKVLGNARGTIEFWFRPEFSVVWPGLAGDKHLAASDGAAGAIELFFEYSTRELVFRMNGSSSLRVTWTPTWAPDDVVHVGLVWDCAGNEIGGGRTMALYVNGVLCEAQGATTTWSPQNVGPRLMVGEDTAVEGEAAFENLRVYDYCKTDFRDRYEQQAPGLMRVRLTLAEGDDGDPGEVFTIESGVLVQ